MPARWRSEPQIPDDLTRTRTPARSGSGSSTTRMPASVLRRPLTCRRPAPGRGDGEIGVRQSGCDPRRHLARQMHRKAAVRHVPADQFRRIRQGGRKRLADRKARGLGGDERSRRTVAELKHRQQRLDVTDRLEMQRRKFDAQHQHPRLGLGPDDMPRGPDRRHCGITAHETDQESLDRGRQPDPLRYDLVDPGCDKTCAARDDEMGDAGNRHLRFQILDRRDAEHGRGFGIKSHPLGGTGQLGARVKARRRHWRSAAGGAVKH